MSWVMGMSNTEQDKIHDSQTVDSSIDDAKWLLGSVVFIGFAVLGIGIVASLFAA